MRISFIAPENWLLEIAGALSVLGHQIRVNKVDEGCDVIIGWSMTRTEEILAAHAQFPNLPLIVYNWDAYRWQFNRPRPGEYNLTRYKELLKACRMVWCPSQGTVAATRELYGVESVCIPAYAPLHHLKDVEVADDGYVLHAMREYPDPFDPVLDKVCAELAIPLKRTRNALSVSDYTKMLARCTFIVSHYEEASTGGLALVEAASLGKPCLVSDSLWNAGQEYVDASTFEAGNRGALKSAIRSLWERRHEPRPPWLMEPTIRTLTDMANDIDLHLKTL